jgi:hypothetical protein
LLVCGQLACSLEQQGHASSETIKGKLKNELSNKVQLTLCI